MDLMTIVEVADHTGIPVNTLRFWRAAARGPRSFKLGGAVRYKRADVEQWLQEQYEATVTKAAS